MYISPRHFSARRPGNTQHGPLRSYTPAQREHSTGACAEGLRPLLAASLLCLLAACATQPQTGSAPGADQRPERPLIDYAQLRGERPKSDWEQAFAAAEAALAAGDWMAAELALPAAPPQAGHIGSPQHTREPAPAIEEVTHGVWDTEFEAYTLYVRAYANFIRGNVAQMQDHLERALALGEQQPLPAAINTRLLQLRLRQQQLAGQHLNAAITRCQLIELVRPSAAQAGPLARELWLDLQYLSAEQLQRASREQIDTRCAGWLQRALVARGLQSQAAWDQTHAGHPAQTLLPSGSTPTMQAAPAMQAPRRITLMLPLEGRIAPAGAAVRDGFMAAYFALPASARAALQISVLDTTAFANARAAYAEALARGSDLVVGPLTKQGVDELLTADNLSVPVLALNRTSDERAGPDGSLQFGLAPEDEVTQVAQRALAAGHRRALLLRPAGDWGNKLELALRAVWESGGGHIVARADYAERSSHSESIKTALGLYQSEQRSREVRRLLGESMESASRRRRDLDVVFMLAPTTADAKSLAPLLAYHYAGDLPRYAISTANSAELREGDRDLEGLHIVEMPWLLSQGSLRRTLQGAALEPGASFSRLHALGVDALALARLPTLPDEWTLHAGVTGFLRANQKRQLDRELKLVEFVRDGLRGE